MKPIIHFLFGILLLGTAGAYAQTKNTAPVNFSGIVTGPDDKPLAGAVVAVQEARTEATTDNDGVRQCCAPARQPW